MKSAVNIWKKQALAAAACAVIFGGGFGIYASDAFNLKTNVEEMVGGETVAVEVQSVEPGAYAYTWTDASGMVHELKAGGLKDVNGTMEPATMQEVWEAHLPRLYTKDNAIFFVSKTDIYDLTDLFKETDTVYFIYEEEGENRYVKAFVDKNNPKSTNLSISDQPGSFRFGYIRLQPE